MTIFYTIITLTVAVIIIGMTAMSYVFAIPGTGKGSRGLQRIRMASVATMVLTMASASAILFALWM